jgi:hypothetical protein
MKRWTKWLLLLVLVPFVSACPPEFDPSALQAEIANLRAQLTALQLPVDSLRAWVQQVTVDRDDTTDPDSAEDPAYLYRSKQAICSLVNRIAAGGRTPEMVALCPIGGDPVMPPPYPPDE